MPEFEIDDSGFPIFLDTRAPGQVAAQPSPSGAVVFRGAASGNPKADPATGRFTGGATSKDGGSSNGTVTQQTKAQKANVDPAALARRRDLVRRAASQMEEMKMGDASTWLEAFGVDVTNARVDTFLADVRQQRIDYLVDAMAPALRTSIDNNKKGQVVQLKVPKVWQSRVINDLTDAEAVALYQRLTGTGFDPTDVSKLLISKITDKKRKAALQQVFGEPVVK